VATRRLSTTLVSNQNVSSPAYLVGSGGAIATSVTIPAHRPGDLIVMFVKASAINTLPTIPTASGTVPSWQNVANTSGTGSSYSHSRVCCYLATANNHTSGTWTNATGFIVAVVRRASGIGGIAFSVPAAQNPATSWTAPAVNLFKSNTTSLVLHFYGWENSTVFTVNAAPTGYTRQYDARTTEVGLAFNTKNVSGSAPAIAQTTTSGTAWYSNFSVEVLAF